jgi:diguanylate cyclase (GGDEF)-like protein
MADVDGFKIINDTLGHDAGDFVLKTAAALLSGSLRAQDMVARWGGDEFLLLLPETDAEGARVICAAISEKFAGHDFSFSGRRLKVAISMGTGTFRAGGTIEECLREADQAMYRSRRQ